MNCVWNRIQTNTNNGHIGKDEGANIESHRLINSNNSQRLQIFPVKRITMAMAMANGNARLTLVLYHTHRYFVAFDLSHFNFKFHWHPLLWYHAALNINWRAIFCLFLQSNQNLQLKIQISIEIGAVSCLDIFQKKGISLSQHAWLFVYLNKYDFFSLSIFFFQTSSLIWCL